MSRVLQDPDVISKQVFELSRSIMAIALTDTDVYRYYQTCIATLIQNRLAFRDTQAVADVADQILDLLFYQE